MPSSSARSPSPTKPCRWPPTATADPTHLSTRRPAYLRPAHQLCPAHLSAGPRVRVPQLSCARLCLWHGRDSHHRHAHDPVLLRRPHPLEQASLTRNKRWRSVPGRRSAVPGCEPHQARPWRLGSAAHRARRLHDPHHLADQTWPGHRPARARRRALGRLRLAQLHAWTPSSRASPAPAVPQPRREQHPLGAARQARHNHVLHERVVILAIETFPVSYVCESERININRLSYPDDGITHVGVRFGYTDEPDVPAALALALAPAAGLKTEVHTDDVSYFLSTIELCAGHTPE